MEIQTTAWLTFGVWWYWFGMEHRLPQGFCSLKCLTVETLKQCFISRKSSRELCETIFQIPKMSQFFVSCTFIVLELYKNSSVEHLTHLHSRQIRQCFRFTYSYSTSTVRNYLQNIWLPPMIQNTVRSLLLLSHWWHEISNSLYLNFKNVVCWTMWPSVL